MYAYIYIYIYIQGLVLDAEVRLAEDGRGVVPVLRQRMDDALGLTIIIVITILYNCNNDDNSNTSNYDNEHNA